MPGPPALTVYMPCAKQKYQHCSVRNRLRVSEHWTDSANSSRRPQTNSLSFSLGQEGMTCLSLSSSTLYPLQCFTDPCLPCVGFPTVPFLPVALLLWKEVVELWLVLWAAKQQTPTENHKCERYSKDSTTPLHWPRPSRVECKLTYWINTIGTWFIDYTPSEDRSSTEMRFIGHHIT